MGEEGERGREGERRSRQGLFSSLLSEGFYKPSTLRPFRRVAFMMLLGGTTREGSAGRLTRRARSE